MDTVLGKETGFEEGLEVLDFEHFFAMHLHSRAGFRAAGLPMALRSLVARYNEIVDVKEADPSLKIRLHTPSARS